MHRPDNYKPHKRSLPTNHTLDADTLQKRANGKAAFGYYTNWSVDRNFSESSNLLFSLSRLIQRKPHHTVPADAVTSSLTRPSCPKDSLLSSSIIFRH